MKSVRDACTIQPNALEIRLSDQVEQLDELIAAEGHGEQFFAKTHITQGMHTLVAEGLARLAGKSSQAVFHLKQAMGGGKTHLLVGFGLLAKHPDLRKKYCAGISYADLLTPLKSQLSTGAIVLIIFSGVKSPINWTRPTGSAASGPEGRRLRMKRIGSSFLKALIQCSYC